MESGSDATDPRRTMATSGDCPTLQVILVLGRTSLDVRTADIAESTAQPQAAGRVVGGNAVFVRVTCDVLNWTVCLLPQLHLWHLCCEARTLFYLFGQVPGIIS